MSEPATNLLILIIGTCAEFAAFQIAAGSAAIARLFFGATLVFLAAIAAALAYIGWQDDGLFGALAGLYRPLGTLWGEQEVSWRRIIVGWLAIFALVLSGVLIAQHPEAAKSLRLLRP